MGDWNNYTYPDDVGVIKRYAELFLSKKSRDLIGV